MTLVYIWNSKDGAKVTKFKKAVVDKEEIGIALKLFRCIGIDVARDKVAKGLYGSRVPLFIAYNAKGQCVDEVEFKDYKCKADPLMKLLVKASKGHGDLPLKSFVKKYRGFLNEIDQIEGKRSVLTQKKARIRGVKPGAPRPPAGKPITSAGKQSKPLSKKDQKKLAKVAKEEKALAKKEEALTKKERKLLADAKAYDQGPPDKKKIEEAEKKPGGG